MTDIPKKIEQLELQGNEEELLGLLACDPEARARHRLRAYKLRVRAIELRHETVARAA